MANAIPVIVGPQQYAIMQICKTHSAAQMADVLNITQDQVRNHLNNMRRRNLIGNGDAKGHRDVLVDMRSLRISTCGRLEFSVSPSGDVASDVERLGAGDYDEWKGGTGVVE